jgi:hypothetical protein
MRSVFNFLIKPTGSRYNNEVNIDGKKLITNTDIFDHKSVSREAEVISTPLAFNTPIAKGDKVIVHHNIFRRWHNIKGVEKNSAGYIEEELYSCQIDQVYAYNPFTNGDRKEPWQALEDYCFVQPIKNKDKYELNIENELVGILIYSNNGLSSKGLEVGDIVGIGPKSQFEFLIDGKRLYRVRNQDISIKYEYGGDEEAYNPSWAGSSKRTN